MHHMLKLILGGFLWRPVLKHEVILTQAKSPGSEHHRARVKRFRKSSAADSLNLWIFFWDPLQHSVPSRLFSSNASYWDHCPVEQYIGLRYCWLEACSGSYADCGIET